jgi:hypothetical protein
MDIKPVSSNWITVKLENGEVYDLHENGYGLCVMAHVASVHGGPRPDIDVVVDDLPEDKRRITSAFNVIVSYAKENR